MYKKCRSYDKLRTSSITDILNNDLNFKIMSYILNRVSVHIFN